jgi:hypothetical protein
MISELLESVRGELAAMRRELGALSGYERVLSAAAARGARARPALSRLPEHTEPTH